jgi:hypothetical protein
MAAKSDRGPGRPLEDMEAGPRPSYCVTTSAQTKKALYAAAEVLDVPVGRYLDLLVAALVPLAAATGNSVAEQSLDPLPPGEAGNAE